MRWRPDPKRARGDASAARRGASALQRIPGDQGSEQIWRSLHPTIAEDLTRAALDSHPALQAVLGLTASSTRGAHAALRSWSSAGSITLVGCDQDVDLLGYIANGEIAAIVAENTYKMGFEAVGLVMRSLAGEPMPAISVIPPLLITKRNLTSQEALIYTSLPR